MPTSHSARSIPATEHEATVPPVLIQRDRNAAHKPGQVIGCGDARWDSTNAAHTEQVSSNLNSFGTFRGRAGFDFNREFLYGTGGLAVGDVRSNTNVSFGTFPVLPVYNGAVHIGSDSQIRFGWVAGVGAEYAFAPNWSVKAEYLYVDLGTQSYRSQLVAAVAPAAVGPGYNWNTSIRERDNILRVGFNYKFR